jgi:hypothetical protein
MLRKIIREEVENMNEMDPTAAAAVGASVSGALGLSPVAQHAIAAAIAGMGGFAAAYKAYPGLESVVKSIPGMIEKVKKSMGMGSSTKSESSKKTGTLVKEGMDVHTLLALAAGLGPLVTGGIAAAAAKDVVDMMVGKIEKEAQKSAADLEQEMLGSGF